MPEFVATVLEPLVYQLGEKRWVFRHDAEGSIRWVTERITADNFREILGDLIDPEQAELFLQAITTGEIPPATQYEMAALAQANLSGQLEAVQKRQDIQRRALARLDQIDGLLAKGDDDAAPFGES